VGPPLVSTDGDDSACQNNCSQDNPAGGNMCDIHHTGRSAELDSLVGERDFRSPFFGNMQGEDPPVRIAELVIEAI
jgi:hypothetical protein